MALERQPDLHLEIAHILFLDIVGFSKLLIDDQAEMIAQLNQVVRHTPRFREAETAGGLIRLATGDGMALVFSNSAEAPVECALEISQALKSYPHIELRMGIHSGPVNSVTDVNDRSNITGAGINIAQRVMDCGDAGHILVSKRVAEDLSQYRQWQPCLHDLGECEVKHGVRITIVNFYTEEIGNPQIPTKVHRQRVDQTGEATVSSWRAHAASRWAAIAAGILVVGGIGWELLRLKSLGRNVTSVGVVSEDWGATIEATIPEKSIAVLPFENLSRDPENAFFTEGIQEEILTRLAKITDLKVISRTSTTQFRSSPDDLREIASKLGVANILEGSVQRASDQVRVNVQLIKAKTGAHLWADTYDRKLTDIFAIESEIAKAIANTLKAELTGREQEAIASRPTESSEAHQLYLKGRYFWNKRTAEGIQKSIDYFNQAINKDAQYASAYAGLADAYMILPNYSQTPWNEAYPKGQAAAIRALRLDDSIAEAHISLANVRWWHDWGTGAEPEFKRGLELDPNYATGHQWYALYLSCMGQHDEAIAEMKKAQELDPFSIIINTELGLPYLYAHQYDQAAEQFQKAIEMDPTFPFAHFALGEAYDRKGRYQEALKEREKGISLAGGYASPAWFAMTGHLKGAYEALGGENYWLNQLELTRGLYEQGAVTAKAVAEIYAILGDKDQAIDWLQTALQQHDDLLVFLRVQSDFDDMRSDPRFESLVKKVFQAK